MKSDKRGLLCIHYYYPPIHSIGVVRNYYLSRELQNHHETSLILTTSNRNILPSSEEFHLDDLNIQELETKDYRSHLANKNSANKNSDNKNSAHFKEDQKKSGFVQFGIKLINSYPFNVWFGEGGRKYIQEGILKGSSFLSKNEGSTIFTSFRPYADIYIGYKLKLAFPECKWVVDFRDLHVDPMYKNVLWKSRQHKFNKKMLSNADLIITVSNGLKKQLLEYSDRVISIYNGCNIAEESEDILNSNFTINYTGSLFGEHRDPSSLLQFIEDSIKDGKLAKDDVLIQYAGKDAIQFEKYVLQYQLEDRYINKGLVSRKESLDMQRKADINILLTSVTADFKGILTGKLFEYIGSLSPILALISGDKDPEIEDLLNQVGGGKVWYPFENNSNTKKWFLELYNDWKAGKVNKNAKVNVEKNLSWEHSGSLIMEAISKEPILKEES